MRGERGMSFLPAWMKRSVPRFRHQSKEDMTGCGPHSDLLNPISKFSGANGKSEGSFLFYRPEDMMLHTAKLLNPCCGDCGACSWAPEFIFIPAFPCLGVQAATLGLSLARNQFACLTSLLVTGNRCFVHYPSSAQ